MTMFPLSPTEPFATTADALVAYLDRYREFVISRVESLTEESAHSSTLPSEWSPLELLVHLRHVERRWLVWGFEGELVPEPFGDWRDGRWFAGDGRSVASAVLDLREQGRTTTLVASSHDLTNVGAPSERWDGEPPPTLERILLHLLQEYARHAGHLDIVVELAGGPTGSD
jgi:uncharacterized damage-inducible protein DinB